jgi:hypothetical protein
MGMKHWWNITNRRRPKYWEVNRYKCLFVHHKSHMEWTGLNPLLRAVRPATKCLIHGTD